ncbi:MAG: M23 family metallopeptidase [Saprospiraceae bacterium]|nr:M23 family metallopeptidase [Saprospiraceae bacterium]
MQGPHGSFSHQNSHAYDFGMRQGSGVHAARAGIVAYVRKDSQKGCPDRSCLEDANSILINHSDGSFASYAHLQYQGSLVEPGDSVQQGQLIGYSGNTGWSSAPHLHFEVFVARRSGRSTLPVRFQTQNGPTENLHEGDSYRRSRR